MLTSRLSLNRPVPLLVIAMLLNLSGATLFAVVAQTASAPQISFRWSMRDRFGATNANGVVDYHWNSDREKYDPRYVHPDGWIVDFDACSEIPDQSQLSWKIDGQPLSETSCKFSLTFPELKTYVATLVATTPDGQTKTAEASVALRDWLIVSIGDSFASGEGNPDQQHLVGAKWIDKRCHRSAFAAPARAALVLEKADPHSSVTFISFACSGAGITYGLMLPQKKGSGQVRPQLPQIFAAVGDRRIDALLVSIGGNDIGFEELVEKAIELRHAETDAKIKKLLDARLAALPERYTTLAQKISELATGTHIDHVFITEYPDLMRNATRAYCDHSVSITDPLHGISAAESDWALNSVIIPLNAVIKERAEALSWHYVDNVFKKFGGDSDDGIAHGFCAKDSRWANTLLDSLRRQGDIFGTIHPNLDGHHWYAERLVQELRATGVGTISP